MFDTIIRFLAQALILVIFVDVVLSWFMRPDQPIRSVLDSVVNPMLDPIRKVIPPIMGLDLSPYALIILIQFIQMLLIRLF